MVAAAGYSDPLVDGGPDSQGALIVSITYSLMFIAITLAAARMYSSFHRNNQVGGDDICFYTALVLLIPQCILTERSVGLGIGKHADVVSESDINNAFKLLYAGQLIGVIVQGLSKFSVILLISRISRATASKGITLYIKIVVGLWTLFSVLAIGLQCGVTAPWVFDRDRCVARGSLYYVVIALNIATDAFLAVFFIPGVLKLQMSKTLHFVISSLFAVRLIVCIASIVHLAFIGKYLTSTDPTWSDSAPVVINEIVINLSLMTAGIPSIHSFLMELQTGQMGAALSKHELGILSSSQQRSKGYGSSSGGNSGNRSKLSSGNGGGGMKAKAGNNNTSTSNSSSGGGFLGVRKPQRLTLKHQGSSDASSTGGSGALSSANKDVSSSKEELVKAPGPPLASPGGQLSTSIYAAPPTPTMGPRRDASMQQQQNQQHGQGGSTRAESSFVIDDDSGDDSGNSSNYHHHNHRTGVAASSTRGGGFGRMEVYQKTDIYVHEEYSAR